MVKYILKRKVLNEQTITELYKILSDKLLDYEDRRMGNKYREASVYIIQSNRLDATINQGLPYTDIPKYMETFLNMLIMEKVFLIKQNIL